MVAMKNQWIVALIVVTFFYGGCASQPHRPPTPAAPQPAAAKKHRTAEIEKSAKEVPPAAIESHSQENKPSMTTKTTRPAIVSNGPAEKTAGSGSSSWKQVRPSGSAPPKTGSGAKAAGFNAAHHQAPTPADAPKKRPMVISTAPAQKRAASHPVRSSKVAVAKPAPATKKPSVPQGPKKRTPASGGQTAASSNAASKTAPSKPSPADDRKTATADKKAKQRADKDAKTQLAMITKRPPPGALDRDVGKWNYDELHLPRTLPGGWVLDIRPDQLGSERRCVLYSAKKPIFDGYENSWVRLQVTTDAIVVNTDSFVDRSYSGQGLRIDNGKLMPFMPALLNKKSTYTKKPALAAMANGKTLTVSLGFWPTWPVTKTQSVSIDLSGFKGAYAALKACSAAQ
jgi:hypothetical protein